jgi:hypothetical protein
LDTIIKSNTIKIEDIIYKIRGKQVMLSSDVAKLYKVETKRINEVIKRNIKRFPESFCFQLNNEELDILCLRSQFATLNKSNNLRGGNIKYLPYVLTEHGIMMLSGLLKSDIAIKVNIQIINAFVEMRKYLLNNNIENRLSNIETKIIEYDNNFKILFDKFDSKTNSNIYFEGQTYDSYSLLRDILNSSKNNIIIIDNYLDKSVLDILKETNKKVIFITNKYNNKDYEKYKSQYDNVTLKISNSFHDRYIIIDNQTLYHSGASFKDLGKKCFNINKIEESKIINSLLEEISELI